MKFWMLVILSLMPSLLLGWGEVGHHLIGRVAAHLVAQHPDVQRLLKSPNAADRESAQEFVTIFSEKAVQQGHVSNIPDIYWRLLGHGLMDAANLLGAPTHYIDLEPFLTSSEKPIEIRVPLDYESARKVLAKSHPTLSLFKDVGSSPWRAQQFYNLYVWALRHGPKDSCPSVLDPNSMTRVALTYAGLLSHFVGDIGQPYHTTVDYDGVAQGLQGVHWYFESTLLDALDTEGLYLKTYEAALKVLLEEEVPHGITLAEIEKEKAKLYPKVADNSQIVATMLAIANNSYRELDATNHLNARYGVATLDEAMTMASCRTLPSVQKVASDKSLKKTLLAEKAMSDPREPKNPACWRDANTRVDAQGRLSPSGKTVAEWEEPLILSRLALSAAVLSDMWVKGWIQAGHPPLCETRQYPLKPSFVSPTDEKCLGYALNENPREFKMKNGKSALPWKKRAKKTEDCLKF